MPSPGLQALLAGLRRSLADDARRLEAVHQPRRRDDGRAKGDGWVEQQHRRRRRRLEADRVLPRGLQHLLGEVSDDEGSIVARSSQHGVPVGFGPSQQENQGPTAFYWAEVFCCEVKITQHFIGSGKV